MEGKKYSRRAKGIAIVLSIISFVAFVIGCIILIVSAELNSGDLTVAFRSNNYENSESLRNELQQVNSNIIYTESIKELLETDGAFDSNKYVDVLNHWGDGYLENSQAEPLEYTIGSLIQWAGQTNFEEDGPYLYNEETDEIIDIDFITDLQLTVDSNGTITLPSGEQFVEPAAPKGYDSLSAYATANQMSLATCVKGIYYSLISMPEMVSHYNNQSDGYDTENTNLRYTITKDGKLLNTNIPQNENSKKSQEVVTRENSPAGTYEAISYLNADYPVRDHWKEISQYYALFGAGGIPAGIVAIIALLGIIGTLIFLGFAAGHVEGREGIALCWIDRPKTEIAMILWGLIAFVGGSLCVYSLVEGLRFDPNVLWLILCGLEVALMAALFLAGYMSLVRRIKAHTIGSNSICGKITGVIKQVIKGTKLSKLMIGGFVVYSLLMGVFLLSAGYGLILALVLNVFAIVLLAKDAVSRDHIQEGLERIASGQLEYKISVEDINQLNLDMAQAVNQVGTGLEAAVEKSIKNERTKSDLITNVSHDIKTPLTSIINYVDLLKRENIDNPTAKGYIDILDEKSQRLKQLTDDLVEASKISSGNITLEPVNMDFSEILQQALGEFENRFAERNLELVVTRPENPVVMNGDGRRVWRIIENLFVNVVKYAMPGTRVYVQLEEKAGYLEFTVKNMSEHPLNISADELTERFIRGDVARSTEGSGLGLSIAKNLTTLQNGTFDIYLDGDLFKVIINFPRVVRPVNQTLPTEE